MSELLLNQERRSPHPRAPSRSVPCPCEGLDPFCEVCVRFGRHLDPDIQARRWAAWNAQEALHRRVEKYKRNHAGEQLPDPFPDLAERRTAARLRVGALAARVGIGVRRLLRLEAAPTEGLEATLALGLRLALGIIREEARRAPESFTAGADQAEEGDKN